MKHAPVQVMVAGILLLGAQAVAQAEGPERASRSVPAIEPASESIDADAEMSVRPGQGVGVFVQYASGGHWNVFTSCDTDRSNQPCMFDLVISFDENVSISDPQGHQLEPVDELTLGQDGTIRLRTGTAGKLDGVTFDADPGATMYIDVLLDGEARPEFVNWVSGGQQLQGTRSSVVGFTPSER